MMKCYDCMEEGKDSEAVSVCIFCGKGMCMDHAMTAELPVQTGVYPDVKVCEKTLPKMICEECAKIVIPEACV
jgi:hypothetical protein